jgi:hypothetical protein
MPSSPDAADKIREKVTAGTLPDVGGITFAGFGTGQTCDGCDTPILPAEMEYEVEARDLSFAKTSFGALWKHLKDS